MAEPASKTEQSESMEEILQSIKKIMDDNSVAEPQKPATASADSDVYDLTNVVKDESAAAEPPTPAAPKAAPAAQPAAPEEVAKPAVTPPPTFATSDPLPAVPPIKETPSADEGEGLLSKNAKSAAASAFKKIGETSKKDYSVPNIPSPQFRSGMTLEDLVLETLRPMLKSWLDENLPVIAQKIVEKEVKRIVTFHYDSE